MVDDNIPWMNDNDLHVVSAKVEETPKFGPQLMVIVQPERDPGPGGDSGPNDKR